MDVIMPGAEQSSRYSSVTHRNLGHSSYFISYGSSPCFSTGWTENKISNFSAEICTH